MKSIITLTCCALCVAQSYAQTVINVPQDVATLSEAVALSQPWDTIQIGPGMFLDSVHINNKSLVIQGDPNGGTFFSPGPNQKSFILNNSNVSFSNLTFDDLQFNTPPPNYAVSADYSVVSMDRCRFVDMFSGVSMLWGDLTISNSVFSRIRGTSIHQNGGTFTIYNNLIHDQNYGAAVINRASGYFFNNTIEGTTPNSNRAIIVNSDTVSHFFNNIIGNYGIGIHLIASDSMELQALRIYNNNIHDVLAPYWYEYNESLSLPIFSGALIPDPGTGEISVSPQFVDATADNYELSATSPCVDAGLDAYPFSVPLELAGTLRVFNGVPDIGAYEFADYAAVDELSKDWDFDVFPVPAQNDVWVTFPEKISGSLEVVDAKGRLLKRQEVQDELHVKIELSVPKGVYLLRLESEGTVHTKRIVKM